MTAQRKPTFQQRIIKRFFPKYVEEMQRAMSIWESAYHRGKAIMPPAELARQLQENGQLTDLILRLRGELVGAGFSFTLADRTRAVQAARYYSATDVSISRARSMWIDWGLGKRVAVTATDNDKATAVLNEFWSAPRNMHVLGSQRIHEEVGYRSLDEGEIAFACWWSPVDKLVTVQVLPSDMLEVVWLDKNLHDIPLFYKYAPAPMQDLYFPDWRATKEMLAKATLPEGALRADQPNAVTGSILLGDGEQAATPGNMVWARRNTVDEVGRGMPQFANGVEWAKVLTQFMGDRAAVARKAAMYTDTITVDGGSRVTADFKSRLESGLVSGDRFQDNVPPFAAASDWVQNEAVNREWQTRDTGATSARFDARMLAGMLGQNTGLPLHWAGFPDAIPGGLATARELLKPWQQLIGRYQLWLSSVFEELSANVLTIRGTDTSELQIVVNMETPIDIDLSFLVAMLKQVVQAFTAGLLAEETAQALLKQLYTLALTEFGIRNASELVDMVAATEGGRIEDMARQVLQAAVASGQADLQAIALLVAELIDGSV